MPVRAADLSPPTRGNLDRVRERLAGFGSIPAHAGEPWDCRSYSERESVYPRPRGGTARNPPRLACGTGLSPSTRGNRRPRKSSAARRWSIPAHAGEPLGDAPVHDAPAVYPRPRGGTAMSAVKRFSAQGLSPPTRGNRFAPRRFTKTQRSIPAHAGEPSCRAGIPPVRAVYPRPRGGTRSLSPAPL